MNNEPHGQGPLHFWNKMQHDGTINHPPQGASPQSLYPHNLSGEITISSG